MLTARMEDCQVDSQVASSDSTSGQVGEESCDDNGRTNNSSSDVEGSRKEVVCKQCTANRIKRQLPATVLAVCFAE